MKVLSVGRHPFDSAAVAGQSYSAPPPIQPGPPEILCHLALATGFSSGGKAGIDA